MHKRSINVETEIRVDLGNWNSIKLRGGAQSEIQYEDDRERVAKEDQLWLEVAVGLRRALGISLKALGKKTDADEKFFAACQERVDHSSVKRQVDENGGGKTAQQGGGDEGNKLG